MWIPKLILIELKRWMNRIKVRKNQVMAIAKKIPGIDTDYESFEECKRKLENPIYGERHGTYVI